MQLDGHRSHIGGSKRWIRNEAMQAIIEQQIKEWNEKYVTSRLQPDQKPNLYPFETAFTAEMMKSSPPDGKYDDGCL